MWIGVKGKECWICGRKDRIVTVGGVFGQHGVSEVAEVGGGGTLTRWVRDGEGRLSAFLVLWTAEGSFAQARRAFTLLCHHDHGAHE